MSLTLSEYRHRLDLDHPRTVEPDPGWEESLQRMLAELGVTTPEGASTAQMVEALHGLLAPIGPRTLDDRLVARIEVAAAGLVAANDKTSAAELPTMASLSRTKYPAAGVVSLWVGDIERHEAFFNLAMVKGHRCQLVAAG